MTRITVDAATAAKLHDVSQYVELFDEAGNLLGHFAPDPKSPAFRAWLRNLDPGMSPEEIERIVAKREGISTEELVAQLRGRKP